METLTQKDMEWLRRSKGKMRRFVEPMLMVFIGCVLLVLAGVAFERAKTIAAQSEVPFDVVLSGWSKVHETADDYPGSIVFVFKAAGTAKVLFVAGIYSLVIAVIHCAETRRTRRMLAFVEQVRGRAGVTSPDSRFEG